MIPEWLLQVRRLAPADRDQVWRLAAFRRAHPEPGVRIREEFGAWQAVVADGTGELVVTRYALRELLDKMDALFSPGRGGAPGEDGDPGG